MPVYEVTVGDKSFEINSQQELTPQQVYAAASKMGKVPAPTSSIDPTEGMSGTQKVLANIGAGMMKPVRGVGQLFGAYNEDDVSNAKAIDEGLAERTTGGGALQLAGEMVPAIPLGAGIGSVIGKGASMLPGAVTRMASTVNPTTLRLAHMGATGGAEGALTQATERGEGRGGSAALGALGGTAAAAAPGVLRRALGGVVTPSAAAERLMARGVQPTMGQAVDPTTRAGSFINRIEETATSLPGIGDIIFHARNRALREGETSLLREMVPPGGNLPSGMRGWEAIKHIKDQYRQAYKNVTDNIKVLPDPQFEADALKVIHDPAIGLNAEQRDIMQRYLADNVFGLYTGYTHPPGRIITANTTPVGQTPPMLAMGGDMAKRVESDLTTQARRWASSSTQQDRAMGEAYGAIEDAWTALRNRNATPEQKAALEMLDSAYARFKIGERAAASAGAMAKEGEWTPRQFLGAIRQGEPNKGRFGAGRSLLQREAGDIANVLRGRVQDSGTMSRLAMATLMAGTAGALGVMPHLAGATVTGGLLSPRFVQRYLTGGYGWQKGARNAITEFANKYRSGIAGAGQAMMED